MDPSILQRLLNGLQAALAPGLATLRLALVFWCTAAVFLELLRVYQAVCIDGHSATHYGKFVLKTMVLCLLFVGLPSIVTEMYQGFTALGLRVGGNFLTPEQFLDPGALLAKGIETGKLLKEIAAAHSGLTRVGYFLVFILCWLIFVVAYGVMSANVFLLQVELSIALPVALLAMVFVFWSVTRPMAAGVFSYVLNICFRFFIMAILASLIFRLGPILVPSIPVTTPFEVAIENAVIMVFVAVLLAYLFFKAQSIVGNLLAGHPTLSAGGALQSTAALLAMGVGATQISSATLRSVVGVGAGGVRGAQAALALPRGAGYGPALAAGASGALRGTLGAVTSGRTYQPPGRAFQNALRGSAQYLSHDQTQHGAHWSP